MHVGMLVGMHVKCGMCVDMMRRVYNHLGLHLYVCLYVYALVSLYSCVVLYQIELVMLQQRLEEITRALVSPEAALLDEQLRGVERSPSPEPMYNDEGE